MKKPPVFVSHSSRDAPFATQLWQLLNDCGITVWDDAQKLRGGDYLKPEILQAIEEARGVIAVLSPDAEPEPKMPLNRKTEEPQNSKCKRILSWSGLRRATFTFEI
ncbi:MAG: toll/interleukin-1 receptor domain-containing protein [Lewinellaceae bacterium]|nr:toll/interleukin-1 receptor domain-containing protein [Lewinellaceae bacterium]